MQQRGDRLGVAVVAERGVDMIQEAGAERRRIDGLPREWVGCCPGVPVPGRGGQGRSDVPGWRGGGRRSPGTRHSTRPRRRAISATSQKDSSKTLRTPPNKALHAISLVLAFDLMPTRTFLTVFPTASPGTGSS